MASGSITSWQVEEGKVEAVTEILFWGGASKIIGDGDCSHEVKKCLLLGRKAVTNLEVSELLKSQEWLFCHLWR